MVLVVDCMTWLVLVPMLMRDPDPLKLGHWRRAHYNFESYMVGARKAPPGGTAAGGFGACTVSACCHCWGNVYVG